MKEKVYCSKCRNYRHWLVQYYDGRTRENEECVKQIERSDYKEPYMEQLVPSVDNKDNSCFYYEEGIPIDGGIEVKGQKRLDNSMRESTKGMLAYEYSCAHLPNLYKKR